MMKHQISKVQSHTLSELEKLLVESSDIFDSDVTLFNESLGGWSNVNIQGQHDGNDFVLKLPMSIPPFDKDHYYHLNEISRFFGALGLTAMPLSMGHLNDDLRTPFIVFDFIHGTIHDSVQHFSNLEVKLLGDSLQILQSNKPPNLRKFKSPIDFLKSHHARIENHEGFSKESQAVRKLIDSFEDVYPLAESHFGSLEDWSSTIMHGDLWTPNIVFQSDRAILLDFDACAYGFNYYDLAYLLETPESCSIDVLSLILNPEEMNQVNSFRPLAVSFVILWSLERLQSIESGLIEPTFDNAETRLAVIGYTRSKISRLKELLSI